MTSRLCRFDRRAFIRSSGAGIVGAAFRQAGASVVAKSVDTPVLSIGYVESGNPAGFPIILLHGFPDDVPV